MAYAGNASGVAKQPAPTRDAGSWQPLLTAVVVVTILVVVAMATAFIANSNRATGIPIIDRGADRIEIVGVPTIDRGADLNEIGVAPVDNILMNAERMPSDLSRTVYRGNANTLEKAERMPSDLSKLVYTPGAAVDHRYDNIDKLRGNLR